MTDIDVETGPDPPRRNQLCCRPHAAEIAAAVEAVRQKPSNDGAFDDLAYRVTDGYYPGEYSHEVDLSDVPPDRRRAASCAVQSELVRRGLLANSVGFDPPRLHVVRIDWADERRPTRPDHR